MNHDSITKLFADKVLTYPLSVFDIDNYRHIINKFEDVMINKNINVQPRLHEYINDTFNYEQCNKLISQGKIFEALEYFYKYFVFTQDTVYQLGIDENYDCSTISMKKILEDQYNTKIKVNPIGLIEELNNNMNKIDKYPNILYSLSNKISLSELISTTYKDNMHILVRHPNKPLFFIQCENGKYINCFNNSVSALNTFFKPINIDKYDVDMKAADKVNKVLIEELCNDDIDMYIKLTAYLKCKFDRVSSKYVIDFIDCSKKEKAFVNFMNDIMNYKMDYSLSKETIDIINDCDIDLTFTRYELINFHNFIRINCKYEL